MAARKPGQKRVRFWAYVNRGPVRMTLADGQILQHGSGRKTEEGWESTGNRWELGDGEVTWGSFTDATDCDGRLSTHATFVCATDKLTAGRHDAATGLHWPAWKRVSAGQRDYQAEAAGY